MKRPQKQELMREQAEERQARYSALSDLGKHNRLVKRGHGHCAEAVRLREKVSA